MVMQKIQGYKNLRTVVRGYYWTLYEGIQVQSNTRFLIQRFDSFFAADEKLRRLLQEMMEETQKLDHPHILTPIALHFFPDCAVLLYNHFEVQSIRETLNHGIPIVERRVTAIVLQCAVALQFALIRSINHGWFCPETILLLKKSDQVKVYGFGAERVLSMIRTKSGRSFPAALNHSQIEQSTDKVSAPDDLFSLGCAGYELLLGKEQFLANCNIHSLAALPPPNTVNPKISQQFSDIIMTLMDVNPHRRGNYNTILDILAPQETGETLAEETPESIRFDKKVLKHFKPQFKWPVRLVGSRKRLVNTLFFLSAFIIVFISMMVISRMIVHDDKKFQATYEEMIKSEALPHENSADLSDNLPVALPSAERTDLADQNTSAGAVSQEVISGQPTRALSERNIKTIEPQATSRKYTFPIVTFADRIQITKESSLIPLPAEIPLTVGDHSITFYDTQTQFTHQMIISVREDSPTMIEVKPESIGEGELLVVLNDPIKYGYAFVAIDDETEQHTTPFRTRLYAGRHRLRIYRETYQVTPADTIVFVWPDRKINVQASVF
ncbi:MAG: hypothetical protein EHM72_18255 [Calditrichaeota bacterium]|nr:MAG: hypothetical protein EHM72_18255 [Calditrichota bacterium]